jgi:hypothetical protein
MDVTMKDLTRLRGVGPVLGRRFVDAGLDCFEKIVEAGAEGLKDIRGLNPRMIPLILSQAAEMNAAAEGSKERLLLKMRQQIDLLAGTVQNMALRITDRFGAESVGTDGKGMEKEILRILALLDKSTAKLGTKKKKMAKGLERAEKRLLSLNGAGLEEILKGLKKSRKYLKRIFS